MTAHVKLLKEDKRHDLSPPLIRLSYEWNAQIFADLAGKQIEDFVVAGIGGATVLGWVDPP